MTLPVIDRDSRSTIAAAEGQAALAAGDTLRAREKYDEAGALLERKINRARKQADKHFFRFLAASQYYHGGNYPKALELCQRIEQRFLPPEVRELYPKFLQDVKTRAAADYGQQVRRKLRFLLQGREYEQILDVLQQHPYLHSAAALAYFRAILCEELKNYRAAAAFYADVLRWKPNEVGPLITLAAVPLNLVREGNLEEGWDYVQHQLDLVPNAVTFIVASLVCYDRASAASGEVRRGLYQEQLRYFDDASRAYGELSSEPARFPELRLLMSWANQAAAFGMLRLSDADRENGERLFSQARELDPQNAELERSYQIFQEAKKQPNSDSPPAWDLRPAHLLVAGRMDRCRAIIDTADQTCLTTAQA